VEASAPSAEAYHLPTGKWYKRRPRRPTEPEGAEAALGRFLANWRNRGRQDTDGVFARADLWHSVANVPVELLRELGVPKPKAAGKALLVLVPLGLACAALAAMAAVVLAVLVAL